MRLPDFSLKVRVEQLKLIKNIAIQRPYRIE